MSVADVLSPSQGDELDYIELDRMIEEDFNNNKENLIMMLQAVQRRYNYLPGPALNYLATKLDLPLSKVYGVATFYSTFSLEPRGRNIISLCLGTACHVRGAERIRERIEETLCVCEGQTTPDRRFTLETVRCIGCCSLGPVVKVNDDTHARIAADQIVKILDTYK
jgi:NADH-quinone oxidoreductase subunit E